MKLGIYAFLLDMFGGIVLASELSDAHVSLNSLLLVESYEINIFLQPTTKCRWSYVTSLVIPSFACANEVLRFFAVGCSVCV